MDVNIQFEINPRREGESTVGMQVQLEIKNGDTVEITASENGEEFTGILLFQSRKTGIESFVQLMERNFVMATANNGRPVLPMCYVNGKWYNPCPKRERPPIVLSPT